MSRTKGKTKKAKASTAPTQDSAPANDASQRRIGWPTNPAAHFDTPGTRGSHNGFDPVSTATRANDAAERAAKRLALFGPTPTAPTANAAPAGEDATAQPQDGIGDNTPDTANATPAGDGAADNPLPTLPPPPGETAQAPVDSRLTIELFESDSETNDGGYPRQRPAAREGSVRTTEFKKPHLNRRYARAWNHRYEDGADESDVDASAETVSKIGKDSASEMPRLVALASVPLPVDISPFRMRRLGSGNCRLGILSTRTTVLHSLAKDYYEFTPGAFGQNNHYLPADALENTLGFLHLVVKDNGSRYLHCLRSPIDYASPPAEPRLYGVGNTTPTDFGSLHRLVDWTPGTTFNSPTAPRQAMEVTFVRENTPVHGIPSWRRLVLCDIVDRQGRRDALESYASGIYVRDRSHLGGEPGVSPPPLRKGPYSKVSDSTSQYLLSRVFPVPTEGDFPLDASFPILPITARENIDAWEAANEESEYSHTMSDILTCPWFEIWLAGALSSPAYFESEVTPFDPHHTSTSWDAAYGSILVSRRMGLDLLERCATHIHQVRSALAAVMHQRLPPFYLCRDIGSLRALGCWGPYHKFILVPTMLEAFPRLRSPGFQRTIAQMPSPAPTPIAHPHIQIPRATPPPAPPINPLTIAQATQPTPPQAPHAQSPLGQTGQASGSSAPRASPLVPEPRWPAFGNIPPSQRTAAPTHHPVRFPPHGTTGPPSAPSQAVHPPVTGGPAPTIITAPSPVQMPHAPAQHVWPQPSQNPMPWPTQPLATQPATRATAPYLLPPEQTAPPSMSPWGSTGLFPSPTSAQVPSPFFSTPTAAPTPVPALTPAFASPPSYGGRVCPTISPYHHASPQPSASQASSISSPPEGPTDRFRFLGCSSWPGRTPYPPHIIHPAFEYPATMPSILLCTSHGGDQGPFVEAPSPTVIMSPLCPAFLRSMRDEDATTAAYSAGQAFHNFVRGAMPHAMQTLVGVTHSCGFFTAPIFQSLKQGMVATSREIELGSIRPTEFSVLHFLCFRHGEGHTSLLPASGWSTLDDALRFICSIQWFLRLILADKGSTTFMHRGLAYLFSLLNTNTMRNAWLSINTKFFSLVVVHAAHTLWTTLFHWDHHAHKMLIYYKHEGATVQVRGAAPFSSDHEVRYLDADLHHWCSMVASRFPTGALELPTAFASPVPVSMAHIFATASPWAGGHTPHTSPDQVQLPAHSITTSHSDPRPRQNTVGLFEKIAGSDQGRRGGLKPFPTFEDSPGTFIEICFAHACTGMQCRSRNRTCPRAHLSIAGTRTAPRRAWTNVRTWLARPEVARHVRLTQEAAAIPGLL